MASGMCMCWPLCPPSGTIQHRYCRGCATRICRPDNRGIRREAHTPGPVSHCIISPNGRHYVNEHLIDYPLRNINSTIAEIADVLETIVEFNVQGCFEGGS